MQSQSAVIELPAPQRPLAHTCCSPQALQHRIRSEVNRVRSNMEAEVAKLKDEICVERRQREQMGSFLSSKLDDFSQAHINSQWMAKGQEEKFLQQMASLKRELSENTSSLFAAQAPPPPTLPGSYRRSSLFPCTPFELSPQVDTLQAKAYLSTPIQEWLAEYQVSTGERITRVEVRVHAQSLWIGSWAGTRARIGGWVRFVWFGSHATPNTVTG